MQWPIAVLDLLRINLTTLKTARGGERKKKQWPSSSPLPPTAKCFAQQQGRKMRLSAAINAENIDRARGKKWLRMRGASPSLPYGQMYYRVAPNEAILKPFPLVQSCVKVFLPSFENHSQNVTLPMQAVGTVQSGAAGHSLGFEDEDLESSPGWWAATVATYSPSRLGELPKFQGCDISSRVSP